MKLESGILDNTILSTIKTHRHTVAWIVQLSIISFYGIFGSLNYTFLRPGLWMYLVCIFSGLAFEIALSNRVKKTPSIISGLIAGAAVYLQLSSNHPLFFVAAIFLAFVFKTFARVGNRHVFNPANIGILALLCLYPNAGTQDGMQWYLAHPYGMSTLVFILGFTTVILAQRWILSASYLIFFLLACEIRSLVTGVDSTFFSMPLIGAGLLIYVFHMISDPVTTPKSWYGQIVFGGGVAILDNLCRHYGLMYSVLIALAVMSALRAVVIAVVEGRLLKAKEA